MELKEELNYIVQIAKKNAKKQGLKLTNEEIATKIGISRTYLSDLLSGAKELREYHINDFKLKLRDELVELTPDRALLNILLKEFAEYKAENENLDAKDIIAEIKNKADKELKDSRKF